MEQLGATERDEEVQEGLRRSNARFVLTMNRILERYNHPFEDDLLVSLDTLTYDTPEGPKRWEQMSRKEVKKLKKEMFKRHRRSQWNTGISKQQSSDFGDEHSTVQQESPESSRVDTSDSGAESGDIGSVRKKLQDIHLQNLNGVDGQIQKKGRVPVDLIVQSDETEIPMWLTVTPTSSSKARRRLTSPVEEPFGAESSDIGSVRKKCRDIHLQNLNGVDGQLRKKGRVPVDLIVQADETEIPMWLIVTPTSSSKARRRLTSPVEEPFGAESGDIVSVRRKCQDIHLQLTPTSSSKARRRLTSPVEEPFGAKSGDIVSVRRKSPDIHLQNLNVDDGQIQKKGRVQVDLIVQADETEIPKWITLTPARSSKGRRRLTSPVEEPFGAESGDIISVRRKFQDIRLQNLSVVDRQIQRKGRVQVDLIVQADETEIPKWITVTPTSSSKGRRRLTSPVEEPFGNQVALRRKKLEFLNECSSSVYLPLQHSGALSSANTIASPRHKTGPELSLTLYDSILGEYQSADEECSWSNTTVGDLYPAMVEIFSKLMTKHSQRKVLKCMLGRLRFKRRHSRRQKLNVTLDKMRGLRPSKLKKVFHSTSSCSSEDNQSPTFGNENREFSCDNCLVSNSYDLVPYSDTDEVKMGYSNSSLEHFSPRKGQKVYKHPAFPDVMDRMGKTFLVEDELQTTASPRHSEYAESEKLAYRRFSEPSFITSTASSYSRALHRVKKIDKDKDRLDELYCKAYPEKFRKSLTLTRPLINSWNLDEKGRLVKSNFGWSTEQLDIDGICEKLSSKSVLKFPGFQTASNFRKYEEILMPETVNALVNSPVRSYSAISRVKRTGNVQNHLLSPEKRLKLVPGHCFTSKKRQGLPISIKDSLQTAGMYLLSTYSSPRFSADHKLRCQGSGSHGSSDKTFLDSGTSLQESGTADVQPCLPGAMENCSSLSNVKKRDRRVYRKLKYTDEEDQV